MKIEVNHTYLVKGNVLESGCIIKILDKQVRHVTPIHTNEVFQYEVVKGKDPGCCNWFESGSYFERCLTPDNISDEKIVIQRIDNDVIATRYKGDTEVNFAIAKCHPDDKFNFEIGADIAFNRLQNKLYTCNSDFDWVGFENGEFDVFLTKETQYSFLYCAETLGFKWRTGTNPTKFMPSADIWYASKTYGDDKKVFGFWYPESYTSDKKFVVWKPEYAEINDDDKKFSWNEFINGSIAVKVSPNMVREFIALAESNNCTWEYAQEDESNNCTYGYAQGYDNVLEKIVSDATALDLDIYFYTNGNINNEFTFRYYKPKQKELVTMYSTVDIH